MHPASSTDPGRSALSRIQSRSSLNITRYTFQEVDCDQCLCTTNEIALARSAAPTSMFWRSVTPVTDTIKGSMVLFASQLNRESDSACRGSHHTNECFCHIFLWDRLATHTLADAKPSWSLSKDL